ncbi:MAG TPA: 16S rRNA (uracil(1498)-N(3))-methyltransferase [Rhizomicrobium sp.]|nr:16S rRNA (uracil(1498)-N(3))-methyltransferase [Rhizomicrobium sp.]
MNDQLSEPGGKVRLYVEVAALVEGAQIAATPAQAHYLLHVMRARAGDRLSLFNGHDGEWLARIAEVTKRSCVFACERRTRAQTDTPDLWLCFAPIKKTPADYVSQKATELGVSVLQPVMTRRTIVSRVNRERLKANAIEAAEQSDRLTVPDAREPITLEKLLTHWPAERRLLFCDEAGEAPPIAQALATQPPPPLVGAGELRARRSNSGEGAFEPEPLPQSSHAAYVRIAPSRKGSGEAFAILTGPEGGFDPAERDVIRKHPFVIPVSIGPRILRADTAALAALSVWQALCGDWRQLALLACGPDTTCL